MTKKKATTRDPQRISEKERALRASWNERVPTAIKHINAMQRTLCDHAEARIHHPDSSFEDEEIVMLYNDIRRLLGTFAPEGWSLDIGMRIGSRAEMIEAVEGVLGLLRTQQQQDMLHRAACSTLTSPT